jgi:hypothetical protein
MIKHNDTNAASINVLAEGELDQVVGGCGGRGHHRGRGYGYGGWGNKHNYDKGTDKSSYDSGSYDSGYGDSSYEPSSGSGYGDSGDNVVVNNQNITLDINIQQVAG